MSVRVEQIGLATLIKEVVACRACHWTWRPAGAATREPCPQCNKVRDVRLRKHAPKNLEKLKEWRAARPGYSTEWNKRYRARALLLVGRGVVACVRCGCDDQRLLEINHKNGGGGKEHKAYGHRFDRAVAKMQRTVEDLELLCRPCNAVHWLESTHGKLPFRVVWEGGNAD